MRSVTSSIQTTQDPEHLGLSQGGEYGHRAVLRSPDYDTCFRHTPSLSAIARSSSQALVGLSRTPMAVTREETLLTRCMALSIIKSCASLAAETWCRGR